MGVAQYEKALLATLCGFICSCSTGLCGFGGTVIFQMLWALLGMAGVEEAGDVRTATAALAFQEIFTCVYLLWRSTSYRKQIRPRMDIWWGLYPPLICTLFLGSLLLVELDASELELVLGVVFWSIGVFKFCHSIQKSRRRLRLLAGGTRRRQAEMQQVAIELQDMGGAPEDEGEDDEVPPIAAPPVAASEAGAPGAHPSAIVRTDLREDEAKMRGLLPQDHGDGDQVVEYDTEGMGVARSRQSQVIIRRPGDAGPECCWGCGCCGPVVGCGLRCRAYYKLHKFVLQVSFVTGIFTGVLGGLFGTGGPPIIVFFALLPGLTKSDMRATASFIDLTVFPFRALFGILLGVMKPEEWLVYLGVGLGSLAGAVLGDRVHHVVPADGVMLFLMCLVLASSAMLCSPANGTTFGWVVLPLFIMVPLLILWLAYLRWKISTFFAPGLSEHADGAAAPVKTVAAADLEAAADGRPHRQQSRRPPQSPPI